MLDCCVGIVLQGTQRCQPIPGAKQPMITKIYFPRIILPLSSILAGLVDFAIAFVVLIGMMLFYKQFPTPPSGRCRSFSCWQ
jgi:ABC-type polysaccharide/polyol phosphate export permease